MRLSIVTINRNNAAGLEKTMRSVAEQSGSDFEYVVVDGASNDESVEVIKKYAEKREIVWISEPDKGIYNGMNKGVRMATGDYVMLLNSGDYLAGSHVVKQLMKNIESDGYPSIYYGNIIKIWPDGRTLVDHSIEGKMTMYNFYTSTLNQPGTLVKKELFERYGYFDEEMKICSDWAWFMKAVVVGGEVPKHHELSILYFDMTGVSESGAKSRQTKQKERRQVLEQMLPAAVLADYDTYGDDIRMMRRIHRHKGAYRLVYLIERALFKMERSKQRRERRSTR